MSKQQEVFGATNPSMRMQEASGVIRFASITGLNSEKENRYRELHANVWPEVLNRLKASNIRNYSIFVGEIDGEHYLFSYHEYVGEDHEADMAALEACPHTQRWWSETNPCQKRLSGEQWTPLKLVFHMD